MGGMCIILSPTFNQAYKKSGREIIKIETGENFEGRLISVPLTFPNVDANRRKIKGELDITLCSIYHPVDNIEFESFNTILSSVLMQLPPETNIILGHDITFRLEGQIAFSTLYIHTIFNTTFYVGIIKINQGKRPKRRS
jgi:hypothetical protein